ncbi:SAM-dependent methyltransferase [Streptomyces sp. BE20]|uniref:SAM-dependent methyltransferase n=1 Tax=Streptomyces sp. BE20 TaxID=3002525 RepID=UPI002E778F0D|nr:SAM-dependent methyltransferase [Streptomyces sp. BE20]MEE1820987.1 SAM-dependent methyltransferase [Streptomyces sp. BE20]
MTGPASPRGGLADRPAGRPAASRPRPAVRLAQPVADAEPHVLAPWWRARWSEDHARPEVRTDAPTSARVAGELLGGKDHFAPDRLAADSLRQADPAWGTHAVAARRLVLEHVARLAADGTAQFADLGCGLTTGDHLGAPPELRPLHTAVLPAAPGARFLYTDRDPMVMAHARALLHTPEPGRARHLQGDLTEPGPLLAALRSPLAGLDWRRPVAVVLSDVLHELTDRQAYGLLQVLGEELPADSVLVVTHRAPDRDEERRAAVAAVHAGAGLVWHPRTGAEVAALASTWRTPGPPGGAATPDGFAVVLLESGVRR